MDGILGTMEPDNDGTLLHRLPQTAECSWRLHPLLASSSATVPNTGEPRSQGPAKAAGPPDSAARLGQYRICESLAGAAWGACWRRWMSPWAGTWRSRCCWPLRAEKTAQSQRFLEEARIAGRLEHPGIATDL